MFCNACGTSNVDGARFCSQCGTAFKARALQIDSTDAAPSVHREVKQVRPWVRFFARMFDIYAWSIVAGLAAAALSRLLPDTLVQIPDLVFGVLVLFIWVFIEGIVLYWFEATPGKWLFRTKVLTTTGDRPSYEDLLRRSFSVWWRGLAAGVPLISLGTLAYSKTQLSRDGITSWDQNGDFLVSHGAIGGIRIAFVVLFFSVVPIGFLLLQTGLYMPDQTVTAESSSQSEQLVSPTSPTAQQVRNQPATVENAQAGHWQKYQAADETAAGMGSESRCYRNDQQTGQCLQWVTPPAGFHWDAQPSRAAPPPTKSSNAGPGTWQQIQWSAEVARFTADFPTIAVPSNIPIFQEKLNLLYSAGKSNRKKLEDAYAAAVSDRQWQPAPAFDRAVEQANWQNESEAFVQSHPEMAYQGNEKIVQEYVNSVYRPTLTNAQIMQISYQEALADRRWSSSP